MARCFLCGFVIKKIKIKRIKKKMDLRDPSLLSLRAAAPFASYTSQESKTVVNVPGMIQ